MNKHDMANAHGNPPWGALIQWVSKNFQSNYGNTKRKKVDRVI